jgi:hypothetical protein
MPKNATHKEISVVGRVHAADRILDSDLDCFVARRAAGRPSDILRTTRTDMGALGGQGWIDLGNRKVADL